MLRKWFVLPKKKKNVNRKVVSAFIFYRNGYNVHNAKPHKFDDIYS